DSQGRQKPYLDGYTLQFFADAAAQTGSFGTRQHDFSYGSTLPVVTAGSYEGLYEFYQRNPHIVLQIHPNAAPSFVIAGHADRPPWNDERVRRAVSMAVPRQMIIDTLQDGRGYGGPWFPWPYIFDSTPSLDD